MASCTTSTGPTAPRVLTPTARFVKNRRTRLGVKKTGPWRTLSRTTVVSVGPSEDKDQGEEGEGGEDWPVPRQPPLTLHLMPSPAWRPARLRPVQLHPVCPHRPPDSTRIDVPGTRLGVQKAGPWRTLSRTTAVSVRTNVRTAISSRRTPARMPTSTGAGRKRSQTCYYLFDAAAVIFICTAAVLRGCF